MVRAELVSAYFLAIYVATVPYSNAISGKNGVTERLKMAAETKIALLSDSKRPRRQKWRY